MLFFIVGNDFGLLLEVVMLLVRCCFIRLLMIRFGVIVYLVVIFIFRLNWVGLFLLNNDIDV